MSSPLLAIATGALKGQLNNRADDAQRRHDAEAAELRKIQLLTQAGYAMHPAGSSAPAAAAPVPGAPVLSAAMQAITGGAGAAGAPPSPLQVDEGGVAPMDPDPSDVPAPPLPVPAVPLPPMLQAASQALQSAPPAAPADTAHARRTVPVNLPGLPPMEFDVSETPESKAERDARLRDRLAAEQRDRRKQALIRNGVPADAAEIYAETPQSAAEALKPGKPQTLQSRIQELVKSGIPLARANAQARLEFGEAPPKPDTGDAKEPSWETREVNGVLVQVNPKSGETRPVRGPGGAPVPGNVPPVAAKGYRDNKALARKITDAIEKVQAYPDAVGFFRGRNDGLDQRYDPNGVAARAALAAVAGQKFHDLSGAAVSASEAARLKPFIPSASDNAKTVLRKLNQMLLEVQGQQSDFEETYPALKAAPPAGAAGGYSPLNPYAKGGH